MKNNYENLIQSLILDALHKHPEGLTTQEIHKIIKTKLKLILKYKKLEEKMQKTLDKIIQ